MNHIATVDRALSGLPSVWQGLRSLALNPPKSGGPAGSSAPGPRFPLALGYFDQAEELHALVASWAMAVGDVIGASPPLRHVRLMGDRPLGGVDPAPLCQWLRSALPEVADESLMADMARELQHGVRRGVVAINGREVTERDRAAARLQLDAWLKKVATRDA